MICICGQINGIKSVNKGVKNMPRRGENIRKRKDGRWEGRYINSYSNNGKAKYVSVYGKSYYEIKKKLKDILVNNINAEHNCSNLFFRELLFLWLSNVKVKLRAQTYVKYLEIIENHIVPSLGMIKANRMDACIINMFLEQKMTNGRLDGNGGLAATYIKTIAYIIQATIEYASQEKLMRPLNNTINKPTKRKQDLSVLTVEEQIILEHYAYNDLNASKLGILICLNIGLRIGEVCGLKWDDIDYINNTIRINRTVERIRIPKHKEGTAKTELVIGEPKTVTSKRILPIPINLIPYIKSVHLKSTSDYVISGITNDFLDPRTYQYRFHKYLEDCNLRKVNFHALRHTFATRCIEVGVDIKSLSEFLGHASVNITLDTYVHSSMKLKHSQINMLASINGQ